MASIEWTRKMSVGVPELDDDHQGLLAVINELAAHAADEADEAVVRRSLNWLLRYAQTHFAREQAVMSSCMYPMLAEHIDAHRDFVERMQQSIARFDEDPNRGAADIRDTLVSYLETWWREHILSEDMKYRRFAEQNLRQARRAARNVRGYEVWWS
jgi:hemerythrin